MSLLPSVQQFLDVTNQKKLEDAAKGVKRTPLSWRETAELGTRKFLKDNYDGIEITDDFVMSGKYPISIRIYNPDPSRKLPVLVFFHGGGFVLGSVVEADPLCRRFAKLTDHLVVFVDYRLAPEFPYPVCIEDSKLVIEHLFEVLDDRKIPYSTKELSISGDSAGGGICVILATDRDFIIKNNITKQVIFYPATNFNFDSESMRTFADGYFISRADLEWFFNNLFQNDEDRESLSPLAAPTYPEMPKTLIFAAENDTLRDGSYLYYDKISGVTKTELILVEGVIHAFLRFEDLHKEINMGVYAKMKDFLSAQ